MVLFYVSLKQQWNSEMIIKRSSVFDRPMDANPILKRYDFAWFLMDDWKGQSVFWANLASDWAKSQKRNVEKDSAVYAFEVTDMMFDFMEPKFEVPDHEELKNGCTVMT